MRSIFTQRMLCDVERKLAKRAASAIYGGQLDRHVSEQPTTSASQGIRSCLEFLTREPCCTNPRYAPKNAAHDQLENRNGDSAATGVFRQHRRAAPSL